ncbi:mRNA splicing protein [Tulasnella sp. JGI-2019a]|nr:mRNA splicing protein [Tulasnella sp. JGI-2019a]
MAALAGLLPRPVYSSVSDDEEEDVSTTTSVALAPRVIIPPYGQRGDWRPTKQEDFADGGAYPECHVAQYPLEMGKKKASAGSTLALQVDGEGNVRYDTIATQGHRDGRKIQSQFKDLVPLQKRTDLTEEDRAMERPSEEEVQSTADRTRAALEALVNVRIKAAQPKNVPESGGNAAFIRYTPGQQGTSTGGLKQRIIKMTEVQEDPLEPPRFKHKKIPRGPPSPPPPILRSPPRKATAAEQKEWMIPPCISNWKNNKGFTIPLDKRLAADGRGLQDVHINDNFAKLSEALHVADRHAREEVRQRTLMQQKIAQKEKASKEEHLRMLAQRAREERGGVLPTSAAAAPSTAARPAAMKSALAGYGSDSGSGSGSGSEAESDGEDELDEEAKKIRDEMRREKRQQREREMRMNNMGTEQRARQLARQTNRDISEKIALGLAKPTLSKESMLDSRLFNRESLQGSFADEDSYGLYDKPLFHGSSAAAAIYKARGNASEGNDESFGGGTEEGISKALGNERFDMGSSKQGRGLGFDGATSEAEIREGPVQFEKDISIVPGGDVDIFGVDKFLDAAKKGVKRGLDTDVAGSSRKRQQMDTSEN